MENIFKSYRKKPIVVKALQVKDFIKCVSHSPFEINGRKIWSHPSGVEVETEEGKMKAKPNDYLIIGIAGEIYPCREDIFNTTYEETENLEIKV